MTSYHPSSGVSFAPLNLSLVRLSQAAWSLGGGSILPGMAALGAPLPRNLGWCGGWRVEGGGWRVVGGQLGIYWG